MTEPQSHAAPAAADAPAAAMPPRPEVAQADAAGHSPAAAGAEAASAVPAPSTPVAGDVADGDATPPADAVDAGDATDDDGSAEAGDGGKRRRRRRRKPGGAATADAAPGAEAGPGEAGPRGQRGERGQRADAAAGGDAPAAAPAAKPRPNREPHPLLHQLARWHPKLFGARFRPLKVGTYEELLERHPELDKEELKAAIAWHARSTRYLEAVAAGDQRHDLDGKPVEPLAPEHRHHAIVEVFRRRQLRAPGQDLKPWLVERLAEAIQASGLDRETYSLRMPARDPVVLQAVQDAFDRLGEAVAKREALRRAYLASGRSVSEFADMYGMAPETVQQALDAGS